MYVPPGLFNDYHFTHIRRFYATDVPPMIIGFVGLISLVVRDWFTNRSLRIVTLVFAMFLFLCTLALYAVVKFTVHDDWKMKERERRYLGSVCFGLTMFTILSAFYSDFALGALVHNWSGTPSSDISSLYWAYYIARHLPIFLY